MLSVEEALQKILDAVNVLETESVPIMESLGQVLSAAGYNSQDLFESFSRLVQNAEAQSKITAEERESFTDSYLSTLDSYTYLED